MVTLCSLTMMTALNVERLVLHLGDLLNPTCVVDLSMRYEAASFRSSLSSNRPVWLAATTLGYTFATSLLLVAPFVHLQCRVLCP